MGWALSAETWNKYKHVHQIISESINTYTTENYTDKLINASTLVLIKIA